MTILAHFSHNAGNCMIFLKIEKSKQQHDSISIYWKPKNKMRTSTTHGLSGDFWKLIPVCCLSYSHTQVTFCSENSSQVSLDYIVLIFVCKSPICRWSLGFTNCKNFANVLYGCPGITFQRLLPQMWKFITHGQNNQPISQE